VYSKKTLLLTCSSFGVAHATTKEMRRDASNIAIVENYDVASAST
jgi:hypothetical protein